MVCEFGFKWAKDGVEVGKFGFERVKFSAEVKEV